MAECDSNEAGFDAPIKQILDSDSAQVEAAELLEALNVSLHELRRTAVLAHLARLHKLGVSVHTLAEHLVALDEYSRPAATQMLAGMATLVRGLEDIEAALKQDSPSGFLALAKRGLHLTMPN